MCVRVYVFVCMTSLKWLLPPCRGLPVHESSTAPWWCQWLRAEVEDLFGLVGGPPTMELDRERQQPEQASGQLIVKHRLSQVRKRMQANIIMQPSPPVWYWAKVWLPTVSQSFTLLIIHSMNIHIRSYLLKCGLWLHLYQINLSRSGKV